MDFYTPRSACTANDGKPADHQPFPIRGVLAKNMNLSLQELVRVLGDLDGDVYCYVMSTVKLVNGCLQHTGCGPNWQGGLITLCTCKHLMRTYREAGQWAGTWVAGFTGQQCMQGNSALVYLMRVGQAVPSHGALWAVLDAGTRKAKAAHLPGNRFGDVFCPAHVLGDAEELLWRSYRGPCSDHVHLPRGIWRKDIDYLYRQRRPALLVGDPALSFIWSKPQIIATFPLRRGQRRLALRELVAHFS